MAKAQRYSMEQIENARKKLRNLVAQKVGKTRAEVAEVLAEDVRRAVRQGYSLQEIRDVLAQSGVSVSLTRMRALLGGSDEKDSEAGECKDKNSINLDTPQADAFSETGAGPDGVRQEEIRL